MKIKIKKYEKNNNYLSNIPYSVITRTDLSPTEKVIYAYYCNRSDYTPYAKVVEDKLGIDHNNFYKAKKKLIEKGLLSSNKISMKKVIVSAIRTQEEKRIEFFPKELLEHKNNSNKLGRKEAVVLLFLWSYGDSYIHTSLIEISEKLSISIETTNNLINTLIKDGLVENMENEIENSEIKPIEDNTTKVDALLEEIKVLKNRIQELENKKPEAVIEQSYGNVVTTIIEDSVEIKQTAINELLCTGNGYYYYGTDKKDFLIFINTLAKQHYDDEALLKNYKEVYKAYKDYYYNCLKNEDVDSKKAYIKKNSIIISNSAETIEEEYQVGYKLLSVIKNITFDKESPIYKDCYILTKEVYNPIFRILMSKGYLARITLQELRDKRNIA